MREPRRDARDERREHQSSGAEHGGLLQVPRLWDASGQSPRRLFVGEACDARLADPVHASDRQRAAAGLAVSACGRVWAPGMAGCATCAEKATEREKAAEKQEAVSQQPEVGLSGHLPLGGTVLL